MDGFGIEKKRLMKEADTISDKISVYAFHYDWSGFSYDDQTEEEAKERQKKRILTGDTVEMKEWLLSAISEHDENEGKLQSLLDELELYEIANAHTIFLRRNHLRHVEDSIEQSDNNFDEIINNLPVDLAPHKEDVIRNHGKQKSDDFRQTDR